MLYIIIALLVIALIYGPFLWVRYVLWRHSKTIEKMPGTGAELAEHLVERFELSGVKVIKVGKGENYYSPDEKIVALSPDVYEGKSLTAVAVATHEVDADLTLQQLGGRGFAHAGAATVATQAIGERHEARRAVLVEVDVKIALEGVVEATSGKACRSQERKMQGRALLVLHQLEGSQIELHWSDTEGIALGV